MASRGSQVGANPAVVVRGERALGGARCDIVGVHRIYMGELERNEWNLTFKSLEQIAVRINVGPFSLLAPEE